MPFSGMLHHMALVRTDVSEEYSIFIITLTKIGDVGTMLAVTGNRRMLRSVHWMLVAANIVSRLLLLVTLLMKAVCSSATLVLTRATLHNIQENGILHSNRHENLKCSSLSIVITHRFNNWN
jgi:hypothetical protein